MTSPMTGWLCLLISATMSTPPGDFPEFKTGQYDITFEESSPDTAPAEVVRRLDVDQGPPPYDIATEKFHVWVPNAYAHDREWGLFVWVDAGTRRASTRTGRRSWPSTNCWRSRRTIREIGGMPPRACNWPSMRRST